MIILLIASRATLIMYSLVGCSRKELKQEIEKLEESLNDMHNLKLKHVP
jgi:hypothetical protein